MGGLLINKVFIKNKKLGNLLIFCLRGGGAFKKKNPKSCISHFKLYPSFDFHFVELNTKAKHNLLMS